MIAVSHSEEGGLSLSRVRPGRRSGFRAGIFLLLLAAVAVAAALLFSSWTGRERTRSIDQWQARLATVADDRRRAIEIWLGERRSDAKVWSRFPTVTWLVSGARSGPYPFPVEQGAAGHLAEILGDVAETYGYVGIWLIDGEARVLASSRAAPELAPSLIETARQAARERAARVEIERVGERIGLLVATPVEGSAAVGGAVLVEEMNPAELLYPLLRSEPVATRSGETLLVERRQDGIRFLSPTRHLPQRLLESRPSRGGDGLYAAELAESEQVGRFVDRRGVPVLAAIRPIEGTGWSVVVKVDESEALEPYRSSVLRTGVSVLGLLVAATVALLALLRSERARALARAASRRASLSLLLDHANDGVLFLDHDGRIRHANPRAERLYGYDREELLRLRVVDLRADGDPGAVDRELERLRGAGSRVFESVHRRRDGSRIEVEISSAAIEVEGEAGFVSLIRDITERKSAEALREGEQRVLERISTGAGLDDCLGAIVRLVEEQERGGTAALLLADSGRLRYVGAPHIAEVWRGEIERPTTDAAPLVRLGERVVIDDVGGGVDHGALRDLAERSGVRAYWSAPVRSSSGATLGALELHFREPRMPTSDEERLIERATRLAAIAIDRDRAERELRRSEEQLRIVFEGSAIGIALVDPQGHPVTCNPALEKLLGYSRSELARMRFVDFTHPDDREADLELYESLLRGERDWYQIDKRYLRKNGSAVWGRLTVSVSSRRDRAGSFVIGMVEDISNELQLQQRLRQVQKMEAVGRLAGGVAHDFNNILGVILGNGELVLSELPREHPLGPRIEEMLAAGNRAASLTRQLLAFSRLQPLEPKLLDPAVVVEDLDPILRRLAGDEVELEVLADPALGQVRADRSQLHQVLMNLVVNSRDAIPGRGRVTIEVRNVELDDDFVERHPGSKPGPQICLRVSDSGHGMDRETLSRVFEPFFTTKAPGKGTGLGLATVYGIVKQSGGYIGIESEPGRGTQVEVYLPRADGSGDAGARPSPRPESAPRDDRGSETVLLVDDDASLRGLLSVQLGALGYRVLSAPGMDEAMRILEHGEPAIDVLLTDIVLSGADGRELARRARRVAPDLAVLFMSGYSEGLLNEASELEAGIRLISKPFTKVVLARRLRELLDETAT